MGTYGCQAPAGWGIGDMPVPGQLGVKSGAYSCMNIGQWASSLNISLFCVFCIHYLLYHHSTVEIGTFIAPMAFTSRQVFAVGQV